MADIVDELDKMTPKPVSERENDDTETILDQMRKRAAWATTQWAENFEGSRAELAFVMAENQWPEKIRQERQKAGRPCLTLNNLPAMIDQILGDLRQNSPSIHISPADEKNEVWMTAGQNPQEIPAHEVIEGLVRQIEYESCADQHYDGASQQAVESGFGWLRVVTEWKDNNSFDQDIRIKHTRDRFSVLMDPAAIEPDMSDAHYCFISDTITNEEFDTRYPDRRKGSLGPETSWWGDDKTTRVCEYWRREPYERELLLLSTGDTIWKDEYERNKAEYAEKGIEVARSRKVTQYKVLWSLVTANDVLEGPVEWPGQTIPVVPVFGKSYDGERGPVYRGASRYAHDAKRMHNFWMTAATERVALAPKSPWVATARQVEGREDQWRTANTENHSVLIYEPDGEAPPPQRDPGATMPAAELNVALQMKDEIKSGMGIYDAALGARSNETSGKAILARQRESDVANFTFADNLSRAIRRIGQIILEIMPHVYATRRVINIRGRDGTVKQVEINKTVPADSGGGLRVVNDIGSARFSVVVKTGPSFTTQREEATEAMLEIMRAIPPDKGVLMVDQLFGSMDWPGAEEIARRFRMTLPPMFMSEEDRAKIPPQEPTPDQQAAMAESQAKMAEAQADMAMAEAKKAEAMARMKEAEVAAGGGDIAAVIEQAVARGVAAVLARMNGGSQA